ncbi:alpha/beta fold hydrolase [Methanobrevibacter sp. UBA212]|uniref:alpha/beta fold hydrolase n=1 Tax=Methanobrevibacter sp. UBA212 TaxID=1915476 RepID=UPI0025D27CC9|nr:alpha/beta fold hydrolase [Methanobrevibacter sp. UBA212]
MKLENYQYKTHDNNIINYYEADSNNPILLIIHAQSANSSSYSGVIKELSKKFHLIIIDCYGHGKSSHNKEKYNIISQGDDLIEFIRHKTDEKISILGHSSGGLIACYIASKSNLCDNLILEDPPLFSSVGEKRFNYYNYNDLSTICHNFINQDEEEDFVYYYFMNQYMWNFFPENSREKIRNKSGKSALKYRKKHPDKPLKIRFWPKKFLEAFNGMEQYDPYFGENFYNDTFNCNINYSKLLSEITCRTLFMKANTKIGDDGIIMGALTDEDLQQVTDLIKNIRVEYFNCGHGIHIEKKKEFVKSVIETVK